MSNVMCMSSIVFVYTSSIVPVGCVLYMFSCYNKIIKKKKKKKKRDHEKFEAAGSQLKLASSYNNVIHKPLLDIHISHVSPPYLHILLGIVKKHHDLFENDLHELDLALANDPSVVTTLVPDNSPLYTYIQNLKNYQKLLAKLGFLEYQLSDDNDSLTETEKGVLEQKTERNFKW